MNELIDIFGRRHVPNIESHRTKVVFRKRETYQVSTVVRSDWKQGWEKATCHTLVIPIQATRFALRVNTEKHINNSERINANNIDRLLHWKRSGGRTSSIVQDQKLSVSYRKMEAEAILESCDVIFCDLTRATTDRRNHYLSSIDPYFSPTPPVWPVLR